MVYADYTYYTDVFLGSALSETQFPPAAERASEYIDYITRGKATDTDAVKRACCALAEAYGAIERVKASTLTESGELQSQSVGSYSVTYRSGAEVAAGLEADLYRVAQRYLARTGLLYRGGGCCVCTRLTL